MKIVIAAKPLHDGDILDELLKKNWKESPITVYIIDNNLTIPSKTEINHKLANAVKILAEHALEEKNEKEKKKKEEENKRKEEEKKKKREEKKQIYKKLMTRKLLFLIKFMAFFSISMFTLWSYTNFQVVYWIVFFTIPFYYFEVRNNIPDENENQNEMRIREEIAMKRIEENSKSPSWDEENMERKYSWCETITGLTYFFFTSFFPGYIDRQLDIFQKEYNSLQSKKRIREKRREFERKKKEALRKKEKAMEKARKEAEEKKTKLLDSLNSFPQQPSPGDDPLDLKEIE